MNELKNSIENLQSIFCIKWPKRVLVNTPDIEPGEDGEDGLDEEGQEEECLSVHHGHHDHSYKGDHL